VQSAVSTSLSKRAVLHWQRLVRVLCKYVQCADEHSVQCSAEQQQQQVAAIVMVAATATALWQLRV
jgi:septum formation topological specificity factor MinE